MKKLVFILALLANSYLGLSQANKQNSVKAGITYIHFGSGDLSGFNYYNEYNRNINRFLTFSPSLHVGFGSSESSIGRNGVYQEIHFTKASFALDANLFVSPMRFERSKIRLGVGPSIRFLSDSYPNVFVFTTGLPQGSGLDPVVYDRPQNWTIGYTLVLEGELTVSPRWITGVRSSVQSYANGERVLNLGLNVGYRF